LNDKENGNGGTLEQYKHPCLIADTQFHERMRKQGPLEALTASDVSR
jgi:hypothetical protein